MPHSLKPLLAGHPFFAGLTEDQLALITGCATTVAFPTGAFVFREGDPADTFYLRRGGSIALEISAAGRGALTVQTLGAGDVAGFSWLLEPHRWECDGRVVERVLAIKMDGACLRGKCDEDPRLGYELMRRFSALAVTQVQALQLQLLDVYGRANVS